MEVNKSELDLKKQQLQEEVERVRQMMLKINNRGAEAEKEKAQEEPPAREERVEKKSKYRDHSSR